MLNLLNNNKTVTVENTTYSINLTFKTVLTAIETSKDRLLTDTDKINIIFNLFIKEPLQYEGITVLEMALVVKECFDLITKDNEETSNKKVFDWNEDAERIYSSFLSYYDIDLMTEEVEWFKFIALFNNLGEQTPIMTAIKYRAMPLPKDKEERKFVKKMKEHYKLQANKEVEAEIQAKRMAALFE